MPESTLHPIAHPPREYRTSAPPSGGAVDGASCVIVNGHDGVDGDRDELLRAAAREVFGLVQMAMQTGPLVGSNAGYFKRCGADVASMAREFLGEILELAEFNDERVRKGEDDVGFDFGDDDSNEATKKVPIGLGRRAALPKSCRRWIPGT